MRWIPALLLALVVGCGEHRDKPEPKILADDSTAPVELLGVSAVDFKCASVAPLDAVKAAVGAQVKQVDSPFKPPAGVPRPCLYVGPALDAGATAKWSFDLDCREGALADGTALMVEFSKTENARPVMVGKSGLDHSGSVLLFIDDDAPCYVRVVGPDAGGRLALARRIAEGLNEHTAPTGTVYRRTE